MSDDSGSMMEEHPDTHGLLNYDLLLLVMSKSRNHEVSQMMRTCSALYRAGAKFILRMPVVLFEEGQMFSFCLFMLVKQPTRFRFLRELTIVTDRISDSVAKMLGAVLRRATHLETLKLNSADQLVASVDGLADAITSSSSLRSLVLDKATKGSLQLLSSMRAQLHNLNISYGETERYYPFFDQLDEPDRSEWHPLALGVPFAPTLEEMELEYWFSNGRIAPPPDTPIYPNVRSLSLCNETPWLRPYIHCLPNLTHLSVNIHIEGMNKFTPNWGLRRRQTNRADQLVHGSWEHLQEFRGGVMSLYVLGLTTHIPHIVLSSMQAVHFVFLPDVLDDARPVHLELSVYNNVCGSPNSEIPTVLTAPGCSALKELSLSLEIGTRNRERDFPAFMDRLIDSLQRLPLEKFHLDMSPTRTLDPTPKEEPHILDVPDDPDAFIVSWHARHPPAPLAAAERFLDEFDLLGFANRVFEGVQTLKDVVVQVTGPRKRERRLAQLQRAEGKEVKVVRNLP